MSDTTATINRESGELERYTAELEAARQWLEAQFHAPTVKLQFGNQVPTPASLG